MKIQAKAPRKADLNTSVRELTFKAESWGDHLVLAALWSLWQEKPADFCEVVKARVSKIAAAPTTQQVPS